MTYLLLALPFVAGAGVLALVAARRASRSARLALVIGLAIVLVLTVVFDSIMIAVGLFTFPDEHLLGIRIGLAPIEDLLYAAVAVLVVWSLWHLMPARRSSAGNERG